jgi:hypothetical protein
MNLKHTFCVANNTTIDRGHAQERHFGQPRVYQKVRASCLELVGLYIDIERLYPEQDS